MVRPDEPSGSRADTGGLPESSRRLRRKTEVTVDPVTRRPIELYSLAWGCSGIRTLLLSNVLSVRLNVDGALYQTVEGLRVNQGDDSKADGRKIAGYGGFPPRNER